MTVEFDASELKTLAANLAKSGVIVPKLSNQALTDVAREAKQDMVSTVPVDTGELRSSIRIRSGSGWREVRAEARHAVFVEYGTSKMSPKPFIGPVADRADEALTDALIDAAVESLDVI